MQKTLLGCQPNIALKLKALYDIYKCLYYITWYSKKDTFPLKKFCYYNHKLVNASQ